MDKLFTKFLHRLSIWFTIASLIGFYPSVALASRKDSRKQSQPVSEQSVEANVSASPSPSPTPVLVESTPTPEAVPKAETTNKTGQKKPNGAAANTYHFNKDTGLWENDHYTWNPATGQTTPKEPQKYSYNPATGHWDTVEWRFDPASGNYQPNITSVASLPVAQSNSPNNPQGLPNNGLSGTSLSRDGHLPSLLLPGLGGLNSITGTNQSTGIFDNFYNASISNALDSTSHTGDATITGNTSAGDATSGNASVLANIMNLMQSTMNLATGNVVTFVRDILGNLTGDLFIDPAKLPANSTSSTTNDTNLTINSKKTGVINNDINLDAKSGNALVDSNTTGGNATTGTADTVANVVNMINSAIDANKSFLGVLNIRGNLNGDILMPPDSLNALLGSNAPSAQISSTKIDNKSLLANINNQSAIHNDVAVSALSGNAGVTDNTSAGNATTGNAETKLNVLNLTGSDIIGDDALLVFINVLGKWTGVIVNAPKDATAAALGGNSKQQTTVKNASAEINSDTSNTISNNIRGTAQSGDANVSNNTKAGNAQSGNSSSSVNLANLINTRLNLNQWFGVLFINVFGTWNGSFGIDTEAGNQPATDRAGSTTVSTANTPTKAFIFKPKTDSEAALTTSESNQSSSQPNSVESKTDDSKGRIALAGNNQTPTIKSSGNFKFAQLSLPLILGAFSLLIFGLDALLKARKSGTVWFIPQFLRRRKRIDGLTTK